MVRGPAAVLAAALGAALLWLAPVLPRLGGGSGDAATLVAGTVGLLGVGACALVVVPAIDARAVLWLAAPACVVLVAAVEAAGAGVSATPVEALGYGMLGTVFAAVLDAPALALSLPIFVAAVDVASVAGGASGGLTLDRFATGTDTLALALPAWGTDATVARLSGADVVLLAAFAAFARHFGLRAQATALALVAGLVIALVLAVVGIGSVPVLALLATAFYAVNADRLGRLVRAARAG